MLPPSRGVATQYPVNAGIRYFDIVITLKVPHDPNWPQVVLLPKMQNLFLNLWQCSVGMPFGNGFAVDKASLTLICIRGFLLIETCPANAEIPACLDDRSSCFGVLKNPKVTANIALIIGHT